MKKLYFIILAVLFAASIQAQAPHRFNYQGVVRNASGSPLVNQAVGLRITIQDAAETALFQETHSVTTNAFGLYNVVVGTGTIVSGSPTAINWLRGGRYIKVEMDPAGGTSYVAVGSPNQLNSVPYAMGTNSVQSSNSGGAGLVGNSASSLWWGFFENSIYRGYLGSYSGKNEDVDFGTGDTNPLGSVHLVIGAVPKVTVDSIGRVGIGTRYPQTELHINDAFGGVSRLGDNGGWTHLGLANSASGPYNAVANGGSYLSFLYAATPSAALTSKMLMDGSGNIFRPTNDNGMALGSASSRWSVVYSSNGTIQTSDERYKTNIQPLAPGLNAVMLLQPISYNWTNEKLRLGTGVNYGFSAQALSETLPDLVIHTPTLVDAETGKPTSEHADAYGVKYAEFTPILVKAIQEQQAMIEQLKQKVAELEKKAGSSK
jgi:hypothetical protein